jgi:hypothetical protein
MAAPTISPRIGFIVDPDGETPLGTNYLNWDKADVAAGEATVFPDVTPPLSYNGALVSERDTGISYTLMDNGAGGYNKRYTTYPYEYCALSGATLAGNSPTYIDWGWTTLSPTNCVNNKPGDQEVGGGAGWYVPLKGLYALSAIYRWIEASDDVLRGALFSINGFEQYTTEKRRATIGAGVISMNITMLTNLNPGDLVRGKMFNNGSAAQLYTSFFASLVRPLV